MQLLFEHSLALPFFAIEMKTDLFQPCGNCWASKFECSTFTALSLRIWNSSTGIPSIPVAFFLVMLPKAHLVSHSRMSGSRWAIIPLCFSGLWRSFLYSSVYHCHLFLISSASVRSVPFLSFIVLMFAWNIPLVFLIFWKRSLVFTILQFPPKFFAATLGKAFLSLLAILWNSAFKLLFLSFAPLLFTYLIFTAIWKASSDSHVAFFCISFLGDGLDSHLLYNVINLCP